MSKISREIMDVIRFMVDGLHVIPNEKNDFILLSLSKKGYKGGFIIVKERTLWYNDTSYLISDRNVLNLENDVKNFYSIYKNVWQRY